MMGGLFLCYEGSEKVLHKFAPKLLPHELDNDEAHIARLEANASGEDLVALEQDKIKGAIRTDFILSAEIVVISLGTMASASLILKAITLSVIAIVMTIGVYGLVALIVKMDDAGVHLSQKSDNFSQKVDGWIVIITCSQAHEIFIHRRYTGYVFSGWWYFGAWCRSASSSSRAFGKSIRGFWWADCQYL